MRTITTIKEYSSYINWFCKWMPGTMYPISDMIKTLSESRVILNQSDFVLKIIEDKPIYNTKLLSPLMKDRLKHFNKRANYIVIEDFQITGSSLLYIPEDLIYIRVKDTDDFLDWILPMPFPSTPRHVIKKWVYCLLLQLGKIILPNLFYVAAYTVVISKFKIYIFGKRISNTYLNLRNIINENLEDLVFKCNIDRLDLKEFRNFLLEEIGRASCRERV